eukprot:CAMPEP_0182836846 /NCGR_PEP_ID=MMETSP0006_2-20121128/22342_1 /TAXON_ID=97485 /ORGANISM="Prymnesium parvum, Strain Texoma1" /LENGTH=60 /DNA_ID=CAMNT_0024965539 /DNA_START=322 /DNA_END=501 /DNA_ORIENTATION=-
MPQLREHSWLLLVKFRIEKVVVGLVVLHPLVTQHLYGFHVGRADFRNALHAPRQRLETVV